jgi:hypothetical protein
VKAMAIDVHPRVPLSYFIDPDDPRAPPSDLWSAMTPEERARLAEGLPSDFTLDFLPPPEGDRHSGPKHAAKDALGRYFQRIGRKVYVSGELPIYYPAERVFAADVIAVLDVEPHPRDRWLVDLEGKGIDFALEIHVHGDPRKDMKKNVERYARLGIPEYFVFDRRRENLHGFRLAAPDMRVYERITGRGGRLESRVLGMELTLEANRVRFLVGDAPVPEADELLARLDTALDGAERRALALEQELEEEQRKREEEQRKREEAERQLAEARAEIERLKRGG